VTHSLRMLSRSLPVVIAAVLSARSALAQGAPPAGDDHDRYCNEHWFAGGSCTDRTWTGPEIMLGMDLGISEMNESGPFGFGNGIGTVTSAGPAWGARVGLEILPWLAVEGRYVGMYNAVYGWVSPAGAVGFLTTGGEAVVRLTAPLPYVHPYVFAGGGYFDSSLIGLPSARAGSVLFSSSEPGMVGGLGLDIPLSWHFSLGAEMTYHFLVGESFSNNDTNGVDGGDITTFNLVGRLRL